MKLNESIKKFAVSKRFIYVAIFCGVTMGSPAAAQDGLGERIGQSIDQGLDRLQGELQEGWESLKKTVDRLGVQGRVYSRLRWDKQVATSALEVDSTEAGVVTLKGQVRSSDARKKAVQLANDTVGVVRVIDQLSVSVDE